VGSVQAILRYLPRATALLLIALAVSWVGYKGSENIRTFVTVTLNGVTLAALFFVVASGFTLIFGLMRVVNMAHGSFYLLAGYLAFEAQEEWFGVTAFGFGVDVTIPEWLIPLAVASVAIAALGLVTQQVFLRWNQGQDLRQALITIAISIILADQMLANFGGIAKDIKQPTSLPESINLKLEDIQYGFFRLAIVLGSAVLIGVLLWVMIRRTRFGMIIRAGVDDRAMVSALGINVQLVFAVAFLLGSFLAGLGGVLGGSMVGLAPGKDTEFLLWSLIVVIIGGMGSLGGAAIGALALGLVNSYADVYLAFGGKDLTNYSILLTFILLVVVLAFRPLGLFGRPA
jgi:branched-chain amino acid transport system permease protein